MIVPETKIIEAKNNLASNITDLKLNIQDFNKITKQIQEIINVLKVVYNTSGGVSSIKKLADIEFEEEKLYQIAENAETISVNYHEKEIIVGTRPNTNNF